MPSLTVQYMSDSGTVELSRDCGEEGTRHMSCRGKEDRDTILNDLTCIDEVDAADNTLKATTEPAPSLSEVHQKSVELIRKVITHNLEDNHIDTAVNTIDELPSPAHIEEKHNLDELMMGDQPASLDFTSTVFDVKPTKKSVKKVDDKFLKKSIKKKFSKKINSDEEFMLGDQPIEDRLSKSITDEILPHAKKSLPQDLKHKAVTTKSVVSTSTAQFAPIEIVSTTVSSAIASSTETRPRRETERSTNVEPHTTAEPIVIQTTVHAEPATEEPITMASGLPITTTSAHLPKITKKSFNSYQSRHRDIDFGTTPHHLRDKPDVDSTNDHFIPPMLLVRTKFSSTRPHIDETTAVEQHTTIHHEPTGVHVSEPTVITTNAPSQPTSEVIVETTTSAKIVTDEPLLVTTTTILETTGAINTEMSTSREALAAEIQSSTTVISTIVPPTTLHVESTEHVMPSTTHAPSFRQPHAPRYTTTHSTSTTTSAPELITSRTTPPNNVSVNSTPMTADDRIIEIKTDATTETILVATKLATSPTTILTGDADNATTIVVAQTTEKVEPAAIASSSTTTTTTTEKVEMVEEQVLSSTIAALSAIEELSSGEDTANHSDFTNAENYQPYRPNRRRSLTKPEVHTYIKKILG